jgi:hypothetical protein
MRAFEFPLRQALEWRTTQLELEENKLRNWRPASKKWRWRRSGWIW